MNRKEVLSELFYDYYFNKIDESYNLGIELDTELFHCVKKINTCEKFDSLADFISYCKKDFYDSLPTIQSLDNLDSLDIDKRIIHIPYSWFSNLERFSIINSAISKENIHEILGISIKDIYFITYAIIIRTITYANSLISDKRENLKKVFGTKHPMVWFTDRELSKFCTGINIASIRKYFNLFSQPLDIIGTTKDIFSLYELENQYAVISLHDYVTYVFNLTELMIVDKLSENQSSLEEYKMKRGKVLEEYVYKRVKPLFADVYKNLKYVDMNGKLREIDVLVDDEEILIYFECKSAFFNIYNFHNDNITKMKLNNAFGRTLDSIEAFHNYFNNSDHLNFFTGKQSSKDKYEIQSKNKKLVAVQITLYPIDLVGTYLHFFDEKVENKFSLYPININLMDFVDIILLGSKRKDRIIYYLKERCDSINNHKRVQIDMDEIDAFGFITDDSLNNGYNTLLKDKAINFNAQIMINSSAYREMVNQIVARQGIGMYLHNYACDESKKIISNLLDIHPPKNTAQ